MGKRKIELFGLENGEPKVLEDTIYVLEREGYTKVLSNEKFKLPIDEGKFYS